MTEPAAPQSLPTAEEFFGSSAKLPTAEEFFGETEEENERRRYRQINTGSARVNPVADFLFSNEGPVGTAWHSAGRVLSAFGQGFDEAFPKKPSGGYVPAGISQEEYEKLKDWVGYKGWSEQAQRLAMAENRVLLRPAAWGLVTGARTAQGLFTGAQAAVGQVGEELEHTAIGHTIGAGKLARDIAASPEAAMGSPHGTGIPHEVSPGAVLAASLEREPGVIRAGIPPEVERARALGVIGPEGEAGWKGYTYSVPKEEAPKAAAAPTAPGEAPAAPAPAVASQRRGATLLPTEEGAPARGNYWAWGEDGKRIELTTTPYDPADIEGFKPGDKFIGEDGTFYEIGEVREDGFVRIKHARPAGGRGADPPFFAMPYGLVEHFRPGTIVAQLKEAKARKLVPESAAQTPTATPPEAPVRSIDEQRAFIANDVTQQLIRAGRPREEAEAAGKIEAEHYVTFANQFHGAIGTPEELYLREGSEIHGPRERPEPPAYAPRAPRRINEEKLSLLQYLAYRGGLQRTADLEHSLGKNPGQSLVGYPLFRAVGGMTEEEAMTAAVEGGYLQTPEGIRGRGNIRDFHELVRQEAHGKKVYKPGYEPVAGAVEGPEYGPLTADEDAAQATHEAERNRESELMTEEDREAFGREFMQHPARQIPGVHLATGEGVEASAPRVDESGHVSFDITLPHNEGGELFQRLHASDYGSDYARMLKDIGPSWEKAVVIDHEGNVVHNPVNRESLGGPAVRIDRDGTLVPGILAYHGSPHDFDRFDLGKIGTGEGAQAYGHGLYFAENEGVAKGYKQALGGTEVLDRNGSRVPLDDDQKQLATHVLSHPNWNGDLDKALVAYRESNELRPRSETEESIKTLERWKDQGATLTPSGKLYQVSIKADPSHFLDWDKPLSEQSEHVQAILRREFDPRAVTREEAAKLRPDMRSLDFPYYAVDKSGRLSGYMNEAEAKRAADLGGDQFAGGPEETQKLREAGIPGIRYLDQGSRAAGEGSRNYVIFDDALIDITHKDGTPVAREERQGIVDALTNKPDTGLEFFQRDLGPPFYSAVERAISASKQAKASPDQWLATLRNTPGVKPEEMEWLGLEVWLKEQKGSVTREEIQDYVRANRIEVREVHRYDMTPQQESRIYELENVGRSLTEAEQAEYQSLRERARAQVDTKFGQYQLPGAENYRELLLTLPPKTPMPAFEQINRRLMEKYGSLEEAFKRWTPEEEAEFDRVHAQEAQTPSPPDNLYRSSHWDEPNIIAHVRFDDRTIGSKKTLFVGEVQSDWHQAGRKRGYNTPEAMKDWRVERGGGEARVVDREGNVRFLTGEHDYSDERMLELARNSTTKAAGVPDAPFKTTWPELAMKRMIRYAAENGYDQISWPADAKTVAQIEGWGEIRQENGKWLIRDGQDVTPIVERYLTDFPRIVNKLTKKYGGKVGRGEVPTDKPGFDVIHDGGSYATLATREAAEQWIRDNGAISGVGAEGWSVKENEGNRQPVHVLPLTDKLRDAALNEGFALFQRERGGIRLNRTGNLEKEFFVGAEGVRPILRLTQSANASTFIHETGHKYLGELMRYAEHPAAPEQLRTDAQTTLQWLGIEKADLLLGKDATTAQVRKATAAHEKFARGFEQYLREGTAPSPALARVFAQFKQWLLQIYDTIRGLGKPISEDIRGVFDRLLTEKVERTTEELPKTRGDTLAAEAEAVAPEKAAGLAEAIQAEKDSLAGEKLLPEEHVRHNDVAPEDRQRPAGSAPLPGAGDASGAQPGEAGGPAGAGEAGAGGSEGVAESALPPGVARSTGKAGAVRTEPPAGVHEPFETTSPFVDKAGNFVLDNITDNEDVRQAIRDSVNRNHEFIDERRGVISDEEAFALAEASGMKVSDLNRRAVGEAFNEEQIIALEKLFIQAATDVSDAAKAAAHAGTDEAYLAYGEAEARQQMILDQVAAHAAGVRAEAGRALHAYQALKKMKGHLEAHAVADVLKASTGQTLLELKQRATALAGLPTPAAAAGALIQMNKPGWGAYALEIFKNFLISGPITHTTYHIGSQMLALYKATWETAHQAAASQIREAITGERGTRVYYGEIGAQLHAMFFGQRDGWRAAWDSLKAGQTGTLPLEELDFMTKVERQKYDTLRNSNPSLTHDDVIARLGIGGATTPFTPRGDIPGVAGTIVRIPGERMVAPLHSFGRTVGYIQSIARQAYRQAANEGLTGNAFRTRYADLKIRPTLEMMEMARKESSEQMLMAHGGELTRKLSGWINWEADLPRPIGKTKPFAFIDPFVHIFSNMTKETVVKRGPAGLLSREVLADVTGKNGKQAQDYAIGRMAAGVSLSVVGGGLAMEGLLTPSAPSDPHEAAMWKKVNGQPHSLRVGNMSIELNRLGVLGLQMGIAADLYHFVDRLDKDDIDELASLLVHSFAQNFLEEGFAKGPSDMMKALNEPDRYGSAWVRNFVSSFVPYSVGMSQVARQIDPYSRQARTMLDAITAKIPFASQTLFPRRDIWGEPILNREYWGVYMEHLKNDPVEKTLLELGVYPSPVKREINGVDLTDEQYDEYAMIAGRAAKLRLNTLIGSPAFAGLPAGQQETLIRSQIEQAHKVAATRVQMMWPQILRDAIQTKVESRTGAPAPVH